MKELVEFLDMGVRFNWPTGQFTLHTAGGEYLAEVAGPGTLKGIWQGPCPHVQPGKPPATSSSGVPR